MQTHVMGSVCEQELNTGFMIVKLWAKLFTSLYLNFFILKMRTVSTMVFEGGMNNLSSVPIAVLNFHLWGK